MIRLVNLQLQCLSWSNLGRISGSLGTQKQKVEVPPSRKGFFFFSSVGCKWNRSPHTCTCVNIHAFGHASHTHALSPHVHGHSCTHEKQPVLFQRPCVGSYLPLCPGASMIQPLVNFSSLLDAELCVYTGHGYHCGIFDFPLPFGSKSFKDIYK